MNPERIKQLKEFLKETPNDPFILYALATEYKESDHEEAKKFFDKLLDEHASYLATYYHAAALYAEHFDTKRAEEIYKKGIMIAQEQHNQHALRELQNAYTNFQFEND